jgi:hypothetical protein
VMLSLFSDVVSIDGAVVWYKGYMDLWLKGPNICINSCICVVISHLI